MLEENNNSKSMLMQFSMCRQITTTYGRELEERAIFGIEIARSSSSAAGCNDANGREKK